MKKNRRITILIFFLILVGMLIWLAVNLIANVQDSTSENSNFSIENIESDGYYLIKDNSNRVYLTTLEGVTIDALLLENTLELNENSVKYKTSNGENELNLKDKILTFVNWDTENEIKKQATSTYKNITYLDVIESNVKDFQYATETKINFVNDEIDIDGEGVRISQESIKMDDTIINGKRIEIINGGTYRISGTMENTRIIVNAKDDNVELVLDNANISCNYSCPIYIYQSKITRIVLEDDSKNVIIDGSVYAFQDEYSIEVSEEPNACLYSKSDLILTGKGILNVEANYNNGIMSKDRLTILGSEINVKAKNHGITGKDSSWIQDANIIVECGGDAIRATNTTDTSLGWNTIYNSTLMLEAGEDGIQTETSLKILNTQLQITTGDGSAMQTRGELDNLETEDVSRKGIKAGTVILLLDNQMKIDSYDDAIHSNGNINITGGIYEVQTGDDAVHAEGMITIHSGNINVLKSCEGLEGSNIIIYDGDINVTSTDDGINVAGDSSAKDNFDMSEKFGILDENGREIRKDFFESGEMTFGGRNPFISGEKSFDGRKPFRNEQGMMDRGELFDSGNKIPNDIEVNDKNEKMLGNSFMGSGKNVSETDMKLIIYGGRIVVNAEGDGIDSNGGIFMSGGEVIVYGPTRAGNGAIDYSTYFEITGGNLVALGSAGMAQNPSSQSSQVCISNNLVGQNANTQIILKNQKGDEILDITAIKTFSHIVISTPELIEGEKYILYFNDEKYTEIEAGNISNIQNSYMREHGGKRNLNK